MSKYHISPKTNAPARCKVTVEICRFGEHYPDRVSAQVAIEKTALLSAGSAVQESVSRTDRIPSIPLGELRVAHEKKGSGYHYQELWVRDESGVPVIYAKVNLVSWGPGGQRPGVVLCDLEINPATRGRGYPLEFLRALKEEHGTDSVELTGTLSEDGYRMYLKMQEHEELTGEKILSIQHSEKLRIPQPGQSYSFVESWDDELGKYRL